MDIACRMADETFDCIVGRLICAFLAGALEEHLAKFGVVG
jgi:hypothetical protein